MKKSTLALLLAAVMAVGLGCGDARIERLRNAPSFDIHDESTWVFSLVAAIEDERIFLYGGRDFGMTLYINGNIVYFADWRWWQPRLIFPQVMYYDLDSNGERELAVILPAGSGTGVSMFDLHIVRGNGDLIVSLLAREINEWMTEPLTDEFSGGVFGTIVNFEFEGSEIKATIAVGRMYENAATPQFFGEIQANVIFDGESLALNNHKFVLYPLT